MAICKLVFCCVNGPQQWSQSLQFSQSVNRCDIINWGESPKYRQIMARGFWCIPGWPSYLPNSQCLCVTLFQITFYLITRSKIQRTLNKVWSRGFWWKFWRKNLPILLHPPWIVNWLLGPRSSLYRQTLVENNFITTSSTVETFRS